MGSIRGASASAHPGAVIGLNNFAGAFPPPASHTTWRPFRKTNMQPQSLLAWQSAEQLLSARQHDAARTIYTQLLDEPALAAMARLRLSIIASVERRHRDAVDHAVAAYEARLPDPDLLELICKRLVTFNEMEAAVECASSEPVLQTHNVATLAELGKLMSDHGFSELAMDLLSRARRLGLDSAALRYLIGLCHLETGQIDAAEAEFARSLEADPDFARAARALSKLKKQTPSSNHVAQLRASITRIGDAHPDAPLLHYALFKELDDLGEVDPAWSALSKGMRLRRRQINHDALGEAALFEHLQGITGDREVRVQRDDLPKPIFIVGMPRSGTTMLDRIVGAHSEVASAGELRDVVTQMRWMCDRNGSPNLDLDLAIQAEELDWSQLGRRYLGHTSWRARGRKYYTDKYPANFVNIGYIARAIPSAKILHMVRDPMDTCFSNLKELFAAAYPHSYDQGEMADHFLRYQRLMQHWREQFPGRILDVNYDALVVDPEAVARQVLDFCGLTWEQDVLALERHGGAVTTASATQVREPIHRRFVGQWRRYAEHLQPLRERLGGAD